MSLGTTSSAAEIDEDGRGLLAAGEAAGGDVEVVECSLGCTSLCRRSLGPVIAAREDEKCRGVVRGVRSRRSLAGVAKTVGARRTATSIQALKRVNAVISKKPSSPGRPLDLLLLLLLLLPSDLLPSRSLLPFFFTGGSLRSITVAFASGLPVPSNAPRARNPANRQLLQDQVVTVLFPFPINTPAPILYKNDRPSPNCSPLTPPSCTPIASGTPKLTSTRTSEWRYMSPAPAVREGSERSFVRLLAMGVVDSVCWGRSDGDRWGSVRRGRGGGEGLEG